jgi:hypothetical protein
VAVAGTTVSEGATGTGTTGTGVATTGTVERTVGVETDFFFLTCVSADTGDACAGDACAGVACAGETETDCFFEGGDGIIYYFMITYIIICLYNFFIFHIVID